MNTGWYGERHRHSLAAKGIKSSTYSPKLFVVKDVPIRSRLNDVSDRNVAEIKAMAADPHSTFEVNYEAHMADLANRYRDLGVGPAQAKLMVKSDAKKATDDSFYSKKYFLLKTEESNTPNDDPGMFGWRHKNDAIKTNAKLETVNRDKRIWLDRIEKGIDAGEYSHNTHDAFLDTFKNIEEEYVNNYITREQYKDELQRKGEFVLNNHSKKASAFSWADKKEDKKEGEATW